MVIIGIARAVVIVVLPGIIRVWEVIPMRAFVVISFVLLMMGFVPLAVMSSTVKLFEGAQITSTESFGRRVGGTPLKLSLVILDDVSKTRLRVRLARERILHQRIVVKRTD